MAKEFAKSFYKSKAWKRCREDRDFVGIERDEHYYQIAKARIKQEQEAGQQLSLL